MNQNLQQIDLNLLFVFDMLMQERNLSRAAERLHKSQPAVSNALSRLREQLGQPLFRRTAKGLEPTAGAMTLHVPAYFGARDQRFRGNVITCFGRMLIAGFGGT
ncbi:LysR family transcriptional regulator [Cupriavidus sp. EM10]|nr:LysR family transcriptional regulator [Cupriavidus sp. EM10]